MQMLYRKNQVIPTILASYYIHCFRILLLFWLQQKHRTATSIKHNNQKHINKSGRPLAAPLAAENDDAAPDDAATPPPLAPKRRKRSKPQNLPEAFKGSLGCAKCRFTIWGCAKCRHTAGLELHEDGSWTYAMAEDSHDLVVGEIVGDRR